MDHSLGFLGYILFCPLQRWRNSRRNHIWSWIQCGTIDSWEAWKGRARFFWADAWHWKFWAIEHIDFEDLGTHFIKLSFCELLLWGKILLHSVNSGAVRVRIYCHIHCLCIIHIDHNHWPGTRILIYHGLHEGWSTPFRDCLLNNGPTYWFEVSAVKFLDNLFGTTFLRAGLRLWRSRTIRQGRRLWRLEELRK